LWKVLNGGVAGSNLATFTYNLAEQRLTRTAGNNIGTTYDYDAAGRLTLLNTGSVLRLDFGHDLRDRRTWTLRNQANGDTYQYYDDSELNVFRHEVNRPDLNFNNAAAWTDTFAYDAAGNRTSVNENGSVTTYTPGEDNRYTAVTGASGSTIAHDARGNVTTWDGKTFTYDADNRLRSVSATGLTMTMDYDGDGRLMKLVKNGTVEYRFYDGAQCFLRTDGNGTALDWTVWGPTPDEVIARNVSGAWQYYHQDQINSVYAVTNAGGSVVERYLYDPFGAPDIRDANWNARSSTTIGNPWLFTGQEWRGDIGLSNYKARWYQPTLGRFMQNDPVRFDAGDINLYRYCFNNPANANDPTGNLTEYEKNQIRESALAGGTVAGTILGGTAGGAGGAVLGAPTGPGAILTGGAGAAAGAIEGAVVGAAVGAAVGELTIVVVEAVESAVQSLRAEMSGDKEGVIYRVPGEHTSSGDPYVGRTTNSNGPAGRGNGDGRDRSKAEVVDKYKGTRDGRTKEQKAMDKEGGVEKLDNKRNEIAPEKRDDYGLPPLPAK
jgi:RHS repeat-associated protein